MNELKDITELPGRVPTGATAHEEVISEQWAIHYQGSPFGSAGYVRSGGKLHLYSTEAEARCVIDTSLHDKSLYRPVRVRVSAAAEAVSLPDTGMAKAFTSEAMSRRDALNMPGPTTWMTRFRQGLALLCGGKEPPLDLCEMWVRGEQLNNGADPLQAWAASNAGVHWMTGIGVIEAAEVCADTPEEGVDHEYRDDRPRPVAEVEA